MAANNEVAERSDARPSKSAQRVLELLKQTEVWSGRDGVVRLEDMTPKYRKNVRHWLNQQALMLYATHRLQIELGVQDVPDADIVFDLRQHIHDGEGAREWVHSTPLYQALRDFAGYRL